MPGAKQPQMSDQQDTGKSIRNADGSVTKLVEFATADVTSVDAAIEMFMDAGITVTSGQELTGGYVKVTPEEKVDWCRRQVGQKMIVVSWDKHIVNPNTPKETEYLTMHIISDGPNDKGKWILNDGSKIGMCGQLLAEQERRESVDPESAAKRSSTCGFVAIKGLAELSEYYFDTRTRKAISRMDMEDFDKYPEEFRELGTPTFRFDV